jgi:hypothetical protein
LPAGVRSFGRKVRSGTSFNRLLKNPGHVIPEAFFAVCRKKLAYPESSKVNGFAIVSLDPVCANQTTLQSGLMPTGWR